MDQLASAGSRDPLAILTDRSMDRPHKIDPSKFAGEAAFSWALLRSWVWEWLATLRFYGRKNSSFSLDPTTIFRT